MSEDYRNVFERLLKKDEGNTTLETIKLLSRKDANLALKTEIADPLRLTIFKQLSVYLTKKKMMITGGILSNIHDDYLAYMVSKNRKGREEIIKALVAVAERDRQEQTTREKLVERQ